MVPRKPKLIAAAAVIAAGLLMAWPLRRSEPLRSRLLPESKSAIPISAEAFTTVTAPVAPPRLAATTIGHSGLALDAAPLVMGHSPQSVTVAKPVFDALEAGPATFLKSSPDEDLSSIVDSEEQAQIHIVHPGDSLERLAKRYLGDEGRAIELFDHNRQVLENPHLLPIGAELRIPASTAPAIVAP